MPVQSRRDKRPQLIQHTRSLIAATRAGLVRIPASGGNTVPLPFPGDRIAFISNRTCADQLSVADANGKNEAQLTRFGAARSVAGDGLRIAGGTHSIAPRKQRANVYVTG